MTPGIRRASDAMEFDTAERCAILEISNDADDAACSIARAPSRPA
jgi:hypothetical protein